jgi:hypothetical protein
MDFPAPVSPVITVSLSPTPNAAGFRAPPVTAHFSCADTGSGIASCPADQTIATDGLNQTVTGTATDRAGRTASVTSDPFSISSAVPTITANVSPAPNAAGWNNTALTVHFTSSDSVSGIASCPAAQVVSTEGSNQVVSRTAVNNAGNVATATVLINLDMTAPVVTLSPPTDSTTGTTEPTPTITLHGTASDALRIAYRPGYQPADSSAPHTRVAAPSANTTRHRESTSPATRRRRPRCR